MLAPAIPLDEETRIETLRGLNILDTPPEERFDRLARLAQRVLDVPIVVVTLVDGNRQWFKSCRGLGVTETPRSISFCGHTILGDDVFVIPDAALDPRFSDNPLVTGAPHIRFYAGQPLKANNNSRLGSLAIIDIKPRQPSQTDLDVLRDLAALVENEINLLGAVETADSLLRDSEAILSATINTALDAVVQIDSAGTITRWNNQAEKMFGWTRAEAIGRMMHETIMPQQYREAHMRGMKHFLVSGEGGVLNNRIEIFALHRDGHEFPIELSITSLKMAGQYRFSAFIRDITARKVAEETIQRQANFDPLTLLPNRRLLRDRLEQEIKMSHRSVLPLALMYIDLDNFKDVNDALGHDMGDILLKDAAQRLSSCVRETDTVARMGGDEFTVILSELDDSGSLERVALDILHKLALPFHLGDEVAYISASIGITLYPADATGIDELFKNSDQAMYAAKHQGRNRFSYFTSSMQEAAQNRMRLVSDLRGALAGNQFRVFYQPIVELATGDIHKAEALIRWQHPQRGLVPPDKFIRIAEDTGMITDIGNWVFHQAALSAARWRVSHHPEFQISINTSPVQYHNEGIGHQAWLAYLQKLGLPGQCITVEITEGLLLDAGTVVTAQLLAFRDAGIQVSLDDFGTGYSSLSYLKKFDIDYLKIDQSFVRNMQPGSDDLVLCEAIIVMAHKLGLKVIAEGVETAQQRDLLAAAGCDYGQGYLFSKAVPAEEFEVLLKHGGAVA